MSSDDWGDDMNTEDEKNGKDEKIDEDDLEGWGSPVAVNDEGWDDAPAANDDDGFVDNSDTPLNAPILGTRQSSFVVLDSAAIEEKQEKLVAQMSEILGVNAEEARLLLRARQWKWKKLQDDWLDDSDKVRQEVGLTSAENRPKDTSVRVLPDGQKVVQCLTAYCDEVAVEKAHALSGCNHWLCEECWKGHLTSEIKRGRECINTRCPGMRCTLNHNHKFGCACIAEGTLVSLADGTSLPIEKLCHNQRQVLAYHEQRDGLVAAKQVNFWLKGEQECIELTLEDGRQLVCTPDHRILTTFDSSVAWKEAGTIKLGEALVMGPAYPLSGSAAQDLVSESPSGLLRTFSLRLQSVRTGIKKKVYDIEVQGDETSSFLANGIVVHNCKGPWSSHGSSTGGFYVCNKYESDVKEGKLGDEETKMRENQSLLQKYTYYYKRFKSAMDGVRFTQSTLRHQIDERFKKEDINKYAFLLEAVDGLISSRRVLQWSFVMGYYLKSSSQKQLFEYQQDLLLENTEQLQDLLENQMDNLEKLLDSRKDIINRTSSIRKFRQEMVAQVERGEFEDLLLAKADAAMGSQWCCSSCRTDNKKEAIICVSCTACKVHGEMECKACKPPSKS